MKAALLIVDVQNALIDENPCNKIQFLEIEEHLLSEARKRKMPVIHIQHQSPSGTKLEPGTPGWEIFPPLQPRSGEILLRKEYNSAFKNTDLNRILSDYKIDTIILTGMQTEYCIDTTCRTAFEKGYKVVIPEGSNTTFNSELLDGDIIILHHNHFIFKDRFAEVLNPEDVIERYYPEVNHTH